MAHSSDNVTVLVFKDNLASRTFQVPLSWISRFGFILLILLIFSAACLFAAAKYYRVASQLNPARVDFLQNELDRVKEDYETRIASLQRQAADAVATAASAGATTAAPPTHATVISAVTGKPVLFADIPAPTSGDSSIPAEAALPFVISQPRATWVSGQLEAGFNIQYTNTDGGSQQGRILLLARGPDTVLAYPEGSLNRAGSSALINPSKGEYFSVSRFREVRAKFPPVRGRTSLNELEVVIFNPQGRVLLYRTVPIQAAAAPVKPKPVATEQPEAVQPTDPPADPAATAPAETPVGGAEP